VPTNAGCGGGGAGNSGVPAAGSNGKVFVRFK
jgi:hypothetical protein